MHAPTRSRHSQNHWAVVPPGVQILHRNTYTELEDACMISATGFGFWVSFLQPLWLCNNLYDNYCYPGTTNKKDSDDECIYSTQGQMRKTAEFQWLNQQGSNICYIQCQHIPCKKVRCATKLCITPTSMQSSFSTLSREGHTTCYLLTLDISQNWCRIIQYECDFLRMQSRPWFLDLFVKTHLSRSDHMHRNDYSREQTDFKGSGTVAAILFLVFCISTFLWDIATDS